MALFTDRRELSVQEPVINRNFEMNWIGDIFYNETGKMNKLGKAISFIPGSGEIVRAAGVLGAKGADTRAVMREGRDEMWNERFAKLKFARDAFITAATAGAGSAAGTATGLQAKLGSSKLGQGAFKMAQKYQQSGISSFLPSGDKLGSAAMNMFGQKQNQPFDYKSWQEEQDRAWEEMNRMDREQGLYKKGGKVKPKINPPDNDPPYAQPFGPKGKPGSKERNAYYNNVDNAYASGPWTEDAIATMEGYPPSLEKDFVLPPSPAAAAVQLQGMRLLDGPISEEKAIQYLNDRRYINPLRDEDVYDYLNYKLNMTDEDFMRRMAADKNERYGGYKGLRQKLYNANKEKYKSGGKIKYFNGGIAGDPPGSNLYSSAEDLLNQDIEEMYGPLVDPRIQELRDEFAKKFAMAQEEIAKMTGTDNESVKREMYDQMVEEGKKTFGEENKIAGAAMNLLNPDVDLIGSAVNLIGSQMATRDAYKDAANERIYGRRTEQLGEFNMLG